MGNFVAGQIQYLVVPKTRISCMRVIEQCLAKEGIIPSQSWGAFIRGLQCFPI